MLGMAAPPLALTVLCNTEHFLSGNLIVSIDTTLEKREVERPVQSHSSSIHCIITQSTEWIQKTDIEKGEGWWGSPHWAIGLLAWAGEDGLQDPRS